MSQRPLSMRQSGSFVCRETLLAGLLLLTMPWSLLADWPTYRHDHRRSGRTDEAIEADKLQLNWVHRTGTTPQTAWSGAAKYDAYGNVHNLKSMRNYDPVFHPVVVGGKVLFGSSVDHAVHCLDLTTGKPQWQFFTNGPVRIAPTVVENNVYFGSDDGLVYCITLDEGKLVWQYAPPLASRQQVVHEGNIISQWPCRTGVVVDGYTAYAAFSLFPWQASYLAALDRNSGKPSGEQNYVKEFSPQQGLTLEGPMLAAQQQLISPQGRVAPLVFKRADGTALGSLPGGGGSMVLVGDDGRVFHGPGNKGGEIYVSQGESRTKLANYQGGVALVAHGTALYVLTEKDLLSLPGAGAKFAAWKAPAAGNLELIMAGDTLITGGRDQVTAVRAGDGQQLWQAGVEGRAYGLASSDGWLVVSTDEGKLFAFGPGQGKSVDKGADKLAGATEPAEAAKPTSGVKAEATFAPAVGPFLRFTGPTTAVVEWETEFATPSTLQLLFDNEQRIVSDATAKTRHQLTLNDLRKDVLYHYQLVGDEKGKESLSAKHECDMFFNDFAHASRRIDIEADEKPLRQSLLARRILELTPRQVGICVDWGCDDAKLAAAIAHNSHLRVIGFDDDPQRVERTRRRLSEAGLYGTRVVVLLVPSLDELPQVSQFADLVVSQQRMLPGEGATQKPVAADVPRPLVRPGGVAVLANPWTDVPNGKVDHIPPEFTCNEVAGPNDQEWAVCVRQSPQGQGVWSHQYGTADNSAYGGESLAGASTSDELRVQWLGRPGPRAQADRSGRKPSPLSAGGRLYVQGLNRITALNAYNGTILWRLEIPDFSRFNIPRDSANWCADENYLYAVVRDRCWKINGATGKVEAFIKAQPGARSDWQYDWGYVACADGVLLGSSVKQGSRHVDFWGGFGWYDDRQGVATFPVCSDKLFGLNASDGEPRWTYSQGLILNSTITSSNGKVYFVESRHPKLREIDSHRVGVPEVWLDQFMVALDLQTGKTVWEVPLDTAKGLIMFHLAASGDRLVLLASDHRYNVYAFDATNGKQLWSQHFDWHSDNHGGHMSRPAIVGNKVFVRPRTLDLTTGELFKETMPGGGCGSYAATDNSLVFRAGNVTMWDMDDNSFSSWHRLRPDCWISTIPAGGMLLSPEGGGGCSCGSWLETSVGFIPEAFPPPKIVASAVKFVDRATVELIGRGQAGGVVHYTLDGTDPDENSPIFEKPITLSANTQIKARSYWSAGKQGRPTASPIAFQQLTRVYPPPVALPKSIPFVDELAVNLARQGELGTIHYTLDGSEPTTQSPTLTEPLKIASTVTLKAAIAYDDGTLGAVLTEKYSKIDTPWGEPVAVEKPQPGLICDCYEGNWKLLPDFAKETIKKTIVVPTITLEPRTANDAFGLRFRGFIKVPADGVYMFFTRSDDGSKLWIGDQLIVNNDGIHGAEEKSGWIALKAGLHPIQIDFWDALWGEVLEVSHEGPGIARQPLPENVLFHEK